jgi:hypothetical protein
LANKIRAPLVKKWYKLNVLLPINFYNNIFIGIVEIKLQSSPRNRKLFKHNMALPVALEELFRGKLNVTFAFLIPLDEIFFGPHDSFLRTRQSFE